MTRQGLQAGFGNSLADVLPELAAQGCKVVRIDCQVERDPRLAQEVLDAGMTPLVIIRVPEQIPDLPIGVMIEVGNEPDLAHEGWQQSPAVYWRTAGACIAYAEKGWQSLYLGAVSNLNARGFGFLRGLPWSDIPSWVGCSHHWYPDDDMPHASHIEKGFLRKKRNTRDQDIADLKAIVGERPLALSETGWWDGPYRTETDVAEWYAFERAFWESHGYAFAVAYQIASAAAPADPAQWKPEHGYGFRRANGSWKPSTQAWFA